MTRLGLCNKSDSRGARSDLESAESAIESLWANLQLFSNDIDLFGCIYQDAQVPSGSNVKSTMFLTSVSTKSYRNQWFCGSMVEIK